MTAKADTTYNCGSCGLALPLRQPNPGEVGSSWCCVYCDARYYGVLDETLPPDVVTHVRPSEDVNPRVVLDTQTFATMFKRRDRPGRILDERANQRKPLQIPLTVNTDQYEYLVTTFDMSAEGLAFCSKHPITPNTIIDAVFYSLLNHPTTKGVVRSCVSLDDDQYRIGIEFLQQPDSAT